MKKSIALIVVVVMVLWVFAYAQAQKKANFVKASNCSEAQKILAKKGVDLDKIKETGVVPRVFFIKLPADLVEIKGTQEGNKLFIKVMLPVILLANERIHADRQKLIKLNNKAKLTAAEEKWLAKLHKDYGSKDLSIEELLKKVDIVPVSLALAQSAQESWWGTSRFALEGNALFGERRDDAEGMIPQQLPKGENYSIRKFESLYKSVKSYMDSINRAKEYKHLRTIRAELRAQNKEISGHALAHGLGQYSQQGNHYILYIQAVIKDNEFEKLDSVKLKK